MSEPSEHITFAALHDRLSAAGCTVGIERIGARHRIVVTEPAGRRWLRVPVPGSFDDAARLIVLSGCLRERCAGGRVPPRLRSRDTEARGSWPELVELAGH